jgi:hypothetical protein
VNKQTKIRLGLLFLLGFGAFVFVYPLSAFWWHLTHGNFIKFANSSIVVPPGWAATTNSRMVTIFKRSATIFNPNIHAMVTLSPISNPPTTEKAMDDLYESFPSVFWASDMVKERSTVKGPIRLGHGESDATCMQSTPISDKLNLTELFCLTHRGRWKATFEGRPQELDEFYRIILSSPAE